MTGENGTERAIQQSFSLRDMMEDGEWSPVTTAEEASENTLVWRRSDPRAQTWVAVAAEVVHPNLYDKWLLAAVKDAYVFDYPVPRAGEQVIAYRPFGQYMKDASGKTEAEVYDREGEPLWLWGVTWYFDQWFDIRSSGHAGERIGLGARAAYQQLHEVFDICREDAADKAHIDGR